MTDANGTAAPDTKPETGETIEENEIRVTAQGKMRSYVAYAATVFTEGKSQTVVLKGMGRVINKTVSLAEILKRRVKGLYQSAEIGSIKVVDKKGGKNGEEVTEITRLLSVIKIVLTTAPEIAEKYQPPIDESMVEPMTTSLPKRGRSHRRKGKKENTETAPETKTETKNEVKPEAKTDAKIDAKIEKSEKSETDADKADAKPNKAGSKSDNKKEIKEAAKGEGETEKVKRPRRRRPRKAKKVTKESENVSGQKTEAVEGAAETAA